MSFCCIPNGAPVKSRQENPVLVSFCVTLFCGPRMARGYSAGVLRNGAAALHDPLQLTTSSMESNLNRGESYFQEIGDL
jgi:hypothetical protein